MKENYNFSEITRLRDFFRGSFKVALSCILLATAVNFSQAQSKRVTENPSTIAQLSYDAQVNAAASKFKSPNVVKSISGAAVALNGVYTVGATGDYATLTAAVADFNSAAITGPVTFMLLDASYPSETFPINIEVNAGSSATNTLTIKPAAGVDTLITGSAAYLIKVNGADYVTIDGSNNGTTTKNLTLNNINPTATANPVMVWVASTATNGADYVTFKNIKFLGLTPAGTIVGLLVSGPTFGAAGTIPNNFLTVENNMFNRSQNAMFILGLATNQDDGAVIKDNVIGSTDPLEMMGFRGIAVQNAKNFLISGNKITGVSTASTSTSSGILIGATINNGTVTKNQISDISNTNTGGYGSTGIYSNAATGSTNILISNNFVSDVYGYGYASLGGVGDNGNGIVAGGAGTGIKIYNNSVSLTKNQTVAGRPSALNILSGVVAGAVDVRNNILVNKQTVTGDRYAIYSGSANTAFSNIDYNDYYSTGANLGYIGSARATLADIQTNFGGNVHSLNVMPTFVSDTDLHLTPVNVPLDNKGTPLADVLVDIDGQTRNATTPDMGADEFTSSLAVDNTTLKAVKLYPNPVVDFVNINYSTKIESVEIYNAAGQKVKSQIWNAASGSMDMRNLAPGMYIIKLKTANDVQAVKVIKK